MFKKVLVALDGSECAERAFEKALEMTPSEGMLTIIHVLQLPPMIGSKKDDRARTLF